MDPGLRDFKASFLITSLNCRTLCHYWAVVGPRGRKKLIVPLFVEPFRCRTEVYFCFLDILMSFTYAFCLRKQYTSLLLWNKIKFKDWYSSGPLFNRYALTTYYLPGAAICIWITKIRKSLKYNDIPIITVCTKCCKNTVNWVITLNVFYLNLGLIQFFSVFKNQYCHIILVLST